MGLAVSGAVLQSTATLRELAPREPTVQRRLEMRNAAEGAEFLRVDGRGLREFRATKPSDLRAEAGRRKRIAPAVTDVSLLSSELLASDRLCRTTAVMKFREWK